MPQYRIINAGASPRTPEVFRFGEDGKKPVAVLTTTGSVAYATFTVMRSGCASAEPYPQNRTFMVASARLICYSYCKTSCGNGHKLTKKNNWIYILTLPFDCPKNGDPLTLPEVNPGKDAFGKCVPCPPDGPKWSHKHCDGTENSHQIVYLQNPITCKCFPTRIHL